KLKKQISFFTKQYLDALAPSNFALTNPTVFQQMLTSQGENIRKGMQNWFEDLLNNPSHWQIQMTNTKAFELGRNIALTKGKVVLQNRLMQLIQYEPTTPTVYQKPLLMVPPWINKYYILDLNEKKSLVKWLGEQGITVFMISWVNPDKSYQDVCFEDYLSEGILTAFDAITKATNEKSINALGFCIGGTLLAVACAYLKAKNQSTIASATFLTSLIDFSEPGDIGVFIDENQIKNIERKMALDGYLDGRAMMSTFNLLRANDLQWSYYINNYLQGKKPIAFDLLFWNSDPSNLPAKMHSYYLRNFYLENRLCIPNALTVLNEKLNLNNVDIPCYFFSTSQDHIAPWQSTFMGAKCFNGNVTFVLGGAGHIAGVVNPPNQHKYGYRSTDIDIKSFSCAQEWLKCTTTHEGSWWLHWGEWLKMHAGNTVKPRIPGRGKLKTIQDAPGDYVRKKID
ncbi:MAG TPA: class I poly(R)-hydroxyalkanoic acid synthase, partial [Candidatus Berkiella sp.]|nr:class I poly(R)-hydroxyalkanoic acid synthase [Candidatus Berkiella sp.]